jgi:hypothetical protein
LSTTRRATFNQLVDDLADFVGESRDMRAQFVSSIESTWGPALDLFEVLVNICVQAGDAFNRRQNELPSRANDNSFFAIARIHARCCLVADKQAHARISANAVSN